MKRHKYCVRESCANRRRIWFQHYNEKTTLPWNCQLLIGYCPL